MLLFAVVFLLATLVDVFAFEAGFRAELADPFFAAVLCLVLVVRLLLPDDDAFFAVLVFFAPLVFLTVLLFFAVLDFFAVEPLLFFAPLAFFAEAVFPLLLLDFEVVFFVGRDFRLVDANSSSCFSFMDFAMLLEAPRSDFLGVSPRFADKAAPAAICCFLDFAGIPNKRASTAQRFCTIRPGTFRYRGRKL